MNIEIDHETADQVVYQRLFEMWEDEHPESRDKRFGKAVKRIFAEILPPHEWEVIFEEDWLAYITKNDYKLDREADERE
jgi:hypothetical protein